MFAVEMSGAAYFRNRRWCRHKIARRHRNTLSMHFRMMIFIIYGVNTVLAL
jgi:hypothetical protein